MPVAGCGAPRTVAVMRTINPDTIDEIRRRLPFRLAVGALLALFSAAVLALVGVVVSLAGPTIPFWVPVGLGLVLGVLYVVAARPDRDGKDAAVPVSAEVDAPAEQAVSRRSSGATVAAAEALVPVPNDIVRLLGSRQMQVMGDEAVRMVVSPGRRFGVIAAAHLASRPDAAEAFAAAVTQIRDESGLPLTGILVDLDGSGEVVSAEHIIVTTRASVAAAAGKLQKFSVAQLMAVTRRN